MTALLTGHSLVALDTSVWIYHLEDHPQFGPLARELLQGVSAGRCAALVSELTLLELLVRPFERGRDDVADEYEVLLTHFPHVRLVPVSREVLLAAARLRARYRVRTPDAILIASAMVFGATRIVTNDRRWQRIEEVDVVCLVDHL